MTHFDKIRKTRLMSFIALAVQYFSRSFSVETFFKHLIEKWLPFQFSMQHLPFWDTSLADWNQAWWWESREQSTDMAEGTAAKIFSWSNESSQRHIFRCTIDFLNSPAIESNQDVMFHISIRPQDKVIVRNHFQSGMWGMEERYGPCLVKKNATFEIVILAELQHYKIAVNGHHLGVFRHRLPLHLVQYVNIKGEVTIDHILLEQDLRSAQQQSIISQVIATPAAPPIMHIRLPVHTQYQPPMQPQYQPPMQPQYQPPPSYFSIQPAQAPQSVWIFIIFPAKDWFVYDFQIIRIGRISIEKYPRALALRRGQRSNIFMF